MSDNVKEITSENFDKEVLESDLPVLIDFGLNGVVHANSSLRQ